MKLHDPLLPFELTVFVDEAGRGPLAGPVWVGGAIQLKNFPKDGIKDSKTLSPSQREKMYQIIIDKQHEGNIVFGSGIASAKDIDEYGIIGALRVASVKMLYDVLQRYYDLFLREKLLESVRGENIIFVATIDRYCTALSKASHKKSFLGSKDSLQWYLGFLHLFLQTSQRAFVFKGLVIDGNHTFGLDELLNCQVRTVIKGDQKNPLISLASIVAKVERDRYMANTALDLPNWGFEKHKGYGTAQHIQLIKNAMTKNKLSKEHRKSFLTKLKHEV